MDHSALQLATKCRNCALYSVYDGCRIKQNGVSLRQRRGDILLILSWGRQVGEVIRETGGGGEGAKGGGEGRVIT